MSPIRNSPAVSSDDRLRSLLAHVQCLANIGCDLGNTPAMQECYDEIGRLTRLDGDVEVASANFSSPASSLTTSLSSLLPQPVFPALQQTSVPPAQPPAQPPVSQHRRAPVFDSVEHDDGQQARTVLVNNAVVLCSKVTLFDSRAEARNACKTHSTAQGRGILGDSSRHRGAPGQSVLVCALNIDSTTVYTPPQKGSHPIRLYLRSCHYRERL